MKSLKKIFNILTLVQLAYCSVCPIIAIFGSLYSAFYPSVFAMACFRISEIAILATFLPWGLPGAIANIVFLCATDLKKSKPALIWTIVAPLLIIVCWFVAVCFFVANGGSV